MSDTHRTEKIAVNENCALCGQNGKLQKSHLIPRFVGKWLKETSATGFLANPEKPEVRVQDLPTLPLLCRECEELFSKSETYFSKNIFFPFHDQRKRSFEYNEQLQKFIVSLSWRTLKMSYAEFVIEMPQMKQFVDQAEKDWSDFLLGRTTNIDRYENHFLLLGLIEGGTNIPSDFTWYLLRATDATLANNKTRVLSYTKFPWMVFVTTILPKSMKGLIGTQVEDKGTITMPQRIDDGEFGALMIGRAELTSSVKIGADLARRRFHQAISKNPQRFIESGTYEVMVAERDLKRTKEIEHMPETVKELVSVIIRAIDDPRLDRLQNMIIRYKSRIIADALSALSQKEALALHELIEFNVKLAATLGIDRDCTIQAHSVWVTFMIVDAKTKEEQRTKVMSRLENLQKERGELKIPLAVFSMNVNDGTYESGFIV